MEKLDKAIKDTIGIAIRLIFLADVDKLMEYFALKEFCNISDIFPNWFDKLTIIKHLLSEIVDAMNSNLKYLLRKEV